MQTATYGTVSLPFPCVLFHCFTKLVLHMGTCMFVAARQAETRNTGDIGSAQVTHMPPELMLEQTLTTASDVFR